MVSEDPWKKLVDGMIDSVVKLPLIARGAESELHLGAYGGIKAVFKYRRPKPYMDPRLDAMLRRSRTVKEAKVLLHAFSEGVSVPRLLAVYPTLYLLVMEYVEGPRMKEVLEGHVDTSKACSLAKSAAAILAKLHLIGIAHGDPTTSNFIVSPRGLVLIDFGLAEYTSDIEDYAVDIHLFRRASLSTHAAISGILTDCFTRGYREQMGNEADPILRRAEEIELRGRYVEERRTVWGAGR
ncbi:MAG: Kae1-associated kinase Bud32 [Desulfurococcales archaeon]|nr:Kae1-associated kinase Bud32 [Desulfurococcales archaeon]